MRMKKQREFKITKKRASPPRIPNYNDKFSNVELLNLLLKRDIAWVLLSAVENNMLEKNCRVFVLKNLKQLVH